MHFRLLSIASLVPLGLASTALADPIASVALGGAKLGCETDAGRDCDGAGPVDAGSVTGQLGLRVAPSVAIVGHAQVASHEDDGVTVSQTVLAGAVRAWLVPRLWLEGGVGVARSSIEFMDVERHSDTAPAIV